MRSNTDCRWNIKGDCVHSFAPAKLFGSPKCIVKNTEPDLRKSGCRFQHRRNEFDQISESVVLRFEMLEKTIGGMQKELTDLAEKINKTPKRRGEAQYV